MDCMIAVRKDWGLKNPASHTVAGSTKSVVQTSSSWKIKTAKYFRVKHGLSAAEYCFAIWCDKELMLHCA